MAQSGKKNLALFQALRKEMAAKAKTAGNTDVPNLQESLVEVHVHGGTKRKVEEGQGGIAWGEVSQWDERARVQFD